MSHRISHAITRETEIEQRDAEALEAIEALRQAIRDDAGEP